MLRHTIPAWLRFSFGLVVGSAIALNAWGASTTVSVGNGSATVIDTSGAALIFPVHRAGDLSFDAYISYKTEDGTAVAGRDYTAVGHYFKIPAGVSNADLRIPVVGSTVNSPDKTFTLDVLGASPMPQALGFAPPQSFATGGQGPSPGEVVTADINGDGLPDIITVNNANNTVSVALNTTPAGAATQSFAAPQTFSTGPSPTTVTVADLNGDGKPDLIVTDSGDGTVSVLINTSDPSNPTLSFQPEVSIPTGAQPSCVTVADINGDGKPDVIVGHAGEAFVTVLLNATPNFAFAPQFSAQENFFVGPDIVAVATADLNGDGLPDVIASVAGSGLVVLLNQTAKGAPAASFASPQLIGGTASQSIAATDVNGDGIPDLVDLNPNGTVEVQLNTTAPGATTVSFSAVQAFAANGNPTALAVADVDGDGMADLLVSDTTDGVVSVLINGTTPWGSTANFAVAQTLAIPGVVSLTTADLNGDGQPDILGAQQSNGGSVTVVLNTTALTDRAQFASFQTIGGTASQSIAAADLNGDGEADLVGLNSANNTVEVQINTTPAGATTASFAPVQAFGVSNSPTSLAVADMNGDGQPDLVVGSNTENSVSVLLNQTAGAGSAVFLPQQVFAIQGLDSLAIVDVNGDGMPDLLAAQQGGNRYGEVSLNATQAGATGLAFGMPQMFDTGGQGPGSGGLAIADMNRDYVPDVIVTDYYGNTVSVSLNTTGVGGLNSSFEIPQTFATGPNPGQVTVADLNGDYWPDLIVANGDGTISVLMNTSAMVGSTVSFAPQVSIPVGSGPSYITVADVNGDGKPDLVVASQGGTSLLVLLNETPLGATTPVFSAPQPFTVGTGILSITTADLNGDGQADVVANLSGVGFGVLMNTHDDVHGAPATATGTIHYEINTPEVYLSSTSEDFGDVAYGQRSGLQSVHMLNDGTGTLSNIAVSVTGADASEFIQNNDCPASLPPNGSCDINITFAPAALGSRSATLSVASNAASSPDSVSLTGTGVGPAATANPGGVTTMVGQAVSGTFSATLGYTGQALTFHTVPNPGHGTVTVTNASTGAFTYTPNAGYAGTDSFYFYATDGYGSSSNTALETITINDVAATANNGSVSTSPDTAVSGTLTATVGYSGQTLTYAAVANPAHGTASVTNTATGAFTYTPARGFAGSDSFTFRVTDAAGTPSNVATVSITVTDASGTATSGSISTAADTAVSSTLAATAAYQGQTFTYSVVTQPGHGTVNITNAATGAFTYTPAAGYAGADSFRFKVTDAYGAASNTATESVTVSDQAPTVTGGSVSTTPDVAVSGTLQGVAVYAGQTLSYSVTQPANGSVSVNAANGSFTYTPNQGFAGSDPFTFKVTDAVGTSSSSATESVTVTDQAPSVSGGSILTSPDVGVNGTFHATTAYTGQTLTYSVIQPTNGTVSVNATSGNFTYTPNQGFAGSDSFSITVMDQWGKSATAAYSVAVNDIPPTMTGTTSVSVPHNNVYNGTFTSTPKYTGQTLTYSGTASHGTVSINATNQTYTYAPAHNYRGTDTVVLTVKDQYSQSATLSVSVTIR